MLKVYKGLMAYANPSWKLILTFFGYTIIAVFFSIFQFALIIPLLNFLFNNHITAEEAARYTHPPTFKLTVHVVQDFFYYHVYKWKMENPKYALYFLATTIVSSVVLGNVFRYLAQRALINSRTMLVKKLREALFAKINHLHLGYFTKEHKGDLLSRMNSDVFEIEAVASNSIEVLFKEPYLFIGYFIALFFISVKLTLFTILIIPVSAFAIASVTKKLRKEAQDAQASVGRLLTVIDETLTGIRIIKAFNAIPFNLKRFSQENDFYRRASLRSFYKRELAPAFSEAAGMVVVAFILIYGGSMVLQGQASGGGLSAGSFIGFIAIFSQVMRPAKAMVVALSNIQRGEAAGIRVLEVLNTKVEIEDSPNAVPLKSFEHSVEFKHVSFGYSDTTILEDVTFNITKGSTIALVGPSGVGKSTIADLVPRFYDVKKGQILIDGTDIRDYTMDSLRSHMSFVTQEIILFNDTIFNNIALGKPNAKMEDVISAARVANAHDFIIETEDGYQTRIGDRGIRLSGGQRQRLSIARAVFKNPSLLILDEATSALDTESEKLVQDALNKLMQGRTVLVIAHRLSTIKTADEIIVLQGGKIVERGSHYNLIGNDGSIYKRLTEMQAIA